MKIPGGGRDNGIPLSHFREQTAMEIVFKDNGLKSLDPRLFSLSLEDHFSYRSDIEHDCLAVRHFMGPIRFRMWLTASYITISCNF